VTEPSHAAFLSYASQDAEAAQKICEALRAAGIEVWFDQSDLRGGDAWDQSIRKQIKTARCSFRSSRTPRTIAARGTSVLNGSWRLIALTSWMPKWPSCCRS
jgi:TIR domain